MRPCRSPEDPRRPGERPSNGSSPPRSRRRHEARDTPWCLEADGHGRPVGRRRCRRAVPELPGEREGPRPSDDQGLPERPREVGLACDRQPAGAGRRRRAHRPALPLPLDGGRGGPRRRARSHARRSHGHAARRDRCHPSLAGLPEAVVHQGRGSGRRPGPEAHGVEIAPDAFVFSLEPDCSAPMPAQYLTRQVAVLKEHLGIATKRPETIALEDQALRLYRQPPAPRPAGKRGPAPKGGMSFTEIGRRLGRTGR
jgi:hypothetical protein